MKTKTVPSSACQMVVGQFELGDNGEDAKSAPIKMRARSGDPITHWFWGKVAHDLSGMQLSKDRLPIDYCHDDREVIGYLNRFDVESGDLLTSGALVPFKDSDRATEVIHKQKHGVPYEASIDFRGPTVLEEVRDGHTAEVNGKTFEGPGVIIRQWTLRGVAVCPHGADSNTTSELFASEQPTLEVQVMSEAVETPEVVETETEAEGTEPVDASPERDERAELKRFMTAFGDEKGARYYAEGKTFADATASFAADLAEENAALRSKVEALELGESEPATFDAAPVEDDGKPKTFADCFRIK